MDRVAQAVLETVRVLPPLLLSHAVEDAHELPALLTLGEVEVEMEGVGDGVRALDTETRGLGEGLEDKDCEPLTLPDKLGEAEMEAVGVPDLDAEERGV